MVHLRAEADPLAQGVVVVQSVFKIRWIKIQME